MIQNDLFLKMQEIEQTVSSHDEQLLLVFEYLNQLEEVKNQKSKQDNRSKIGFKK